MKTCSTCKEHKDPAAFRKDRTQTDGLQPRCRLCASTRTRSLYTEKYGEGVRARSRVRGMRNRRVLSEIKARLKCTHCGEGEPICLEFHHLDPLQKDIEISRSSACSLEHLLDEISKCVCVCSNCHKKVHAGLIDTTRWNTIIIDPNADVPPGGWTPEIGK